METGYLNKQGNWTVYTHWMMRERYYYDLRFEGPKWYPYNTIQDASYFGIWVNRFDRVIVTFAEGDETTVFCQTDHQFFRELFAMDQFYATC